MSKSLKALRQAKGLKQHEMADKLGYTPTSYNRIENGERGMSKGRMIKAAKILGCSLDEIFFAVQFPKTDKEDK